MKYKTDLQKVIDTISNCYYDLYMSEADCIKSFLDDLYSNYDYDTLQLFIDEKTTTEDL